MDGKEFAVVVPWMENGNIIKFLREDLEANPLKLARTTFHSMHPSIESGHSWRMSHVAFSIYMTRISPMVTSKEYDSCASFQTMTLTGWCRKTFLSPTTVAPVSRMLDSLGSLPIWFQLLPVP